MHDLPCSDNMKIDPQLLRQLREERAWTQEHLADAAGVSLRTVQRIEREGNASADSRLALAAAFGVDVSILVGKTDEASTPPPSPATDPTLETRVMPSAMGGIVQHLLVYLSVCSLLVFLDFSSGSANHWSKWPVLGWGFGVLMHALSAWAKPSRSREDHLQDRKHRRIFPGRVRLYVLMSVAFLVIDYMANGRLTWAFYPILGWGIGLLMGWTKAKAT